MQLRQPARIHFALDESALRGMDSWAACFQGMSGVDLPRFRSAGLSGEAEFHCSGWLGAAARGLTPWTDACAQCKTDINEVKGIMVQNIEKVLDRGEKIELLVTRTDALQVGPACPLSIILRHLQWKLPVLPRGFVLQRPPGPALLADGRRSRLRSGGKRESFGARFGGRSPPPSPPFPLVCSPVWPTAAHPAPCPSSTSGPMAASTHPSSAPQSFPLLLLLVECAHGRPHWAAGAPPPVHRAGAGVRTGHQPLLPLIPYYGEDVPPAGLRSRVSAGIM